MDLEERLPEEVKKWCSHFILRLLYLVIFVRILRHKLYGIILDFVGYTCDERNMNIGQVFTFSDAGVRKKMDIGQLSMHTRKKRIISERDSPP